MYSLASDHPHSSSKIKALEKKKKRCTEVTGIILKLHVILQLDLKTGIQSISKVKENKHTSFEEV